MTKVCTKCKQELPLTAFGELKTAKDGRRSRCKKCEASAKAEWYKSEHGQAVIKAWKESEAGRASIKRWNNSVAHKEDVKNYGATEKGKAVARKAAANTRKKPNWKVIVERYRKTPKYRAKCHREAQSEARKRAIIKHYFKRRNIAGQKLCDAMKAGIYLSLKTKKNGRKWESLVNFTIQELMVHLEKLFQPGMTWENYGEWHLDHVLPRAAHFYTDSSDPDFKRCWALENLQPLWATDNKLKSAKITKPFQPTLDLLFKSRAAIDKIT